MPELDQKLTSVFGGRVVRKDLSRKVKVGANIPVFVLEYLLGKYCATNDEVALTAGLKVVKDTIANNVPRPEEANKIQSLVREKGEYTLIDKVKVRYVSEQDKYWAEIANFGHRFVHIPEERVRSNDRLLMGGLWAQIKLRHQFDDSQSGTKSPFWIEELKPIQLAAFDLKDYQERRRQFTTSEWIDILIRTMGMEPSTMEERLKVLYLCRLIPLCETNYNLIELGPRGTGKSYAFQQLSPYVILMTGPTTVANLFYNIASGRMGLVGLWDAIGFDEVADLQKMPKEVVTTLKTYCESGEFARGKESLSAQASLALFGNTNQPIEVMMRHSHLFSPLPDVIREDMAFLDRLHFYLPGWEIPKVHNDSLTDHYGFVVDYIAEALKELRKHHFVEVADQYFQFGAHLNTRDTKAVRKTLSGLIKLIYPHGEFDKEELRELMEVALEGRRRVKEQLKKLGSFEYHQTSFSYIDNETREESFVGVPEGGGHDAIASDPLAPGSVYAASVDDQGKVGLHRLEIGVSSGTGKLRAANGLDGITRETINRAFAYLQGHKVDLGVAQLMQTTDFHVEIVDLLTNRVPCDCGMALIIAILSALHKKQVAPALVVLGDLSIQGNIKGVRTLAEPLQIAMENGARRALIPLENKRHFLDVSADIMERVDPIFYGDPDTAALKALGLS